MGALARRMGGSPKLSFSKTARRNLRSEMRLKARTPWQSEKLQQKLCNCPADISSVDV